MWQNMLEFFFAMVSHENAFALTWKNLKIITMLHNVQTAIIKPINHHKSINLVNDIHYKNDLK